jgi:hypothetical protein
MKYISQVETNKMMRKALKDAFPGVKFSVRGHDSSSRVIWEDGPSEDAVNKVVQQFRGASFDGMIDLESPVSHMVNGEEVHYGSKYIFTERKVGEASRVEALAWLHAHGFEGLEDSVVAGSFSLFDHKGYGEFLGLRRASNNYRAVYPMVTGHEMVSMVAVFLSSETVAA